jgi:hypothetical protein
MSLVSSFISTHLISLLETEFANNEPEIQATIVSEMEAFVSAAGAWIESKLTKPTAGASS